MTPRLHATTYETRTGCVPMYVICNDIDGRLVRITVRLGSPGGCARAMTDAVATMITRSLDGGTDPERIVEDLAGIGCHQVVAGGAVSCIDALAVVIRAHVDGGVA